MAEGTRKALAYLSVGVAVGERVFAPVLVERLLRLALDRLREVVLVNAFLHNCVLYEYEKCIFYEKK